MNTVTIKVSPETAKKLLAEGQAEVSEMENRLAAKKAEVDELHMAVHGYVDVPDSTPVSVTKNTKSGRARKGESYRAIRSFFEAHRGSPWSIAEVAEKTNTSQTTAFRIIKKLAKERLIDGVNGRWSIPA